MKIVKKAQTITPFGGVYLIDEAFQFLGIDKLIDTFLGFRTAHYSYSNIFRNIFSIFLSGGSCMEDIQTNFRSTLESIPNNKVPSADTLLRSFKELATDNTLITSSSDKIYNFNVNEKVNDLNIRILKRIKHLQSNYSYDFDYDNQIIEHEKYDAKRTYKHTTGYCPGIASIGNKIVYIENRDGNAQVKLEQALTLARAYKLLADHLIKVNRSRMDAGSYSKEIIEVVSQNSKLFYIRANKCESLLEKMDAIKHWETVEINHKTYEVASMPFTQFLEEKNFKLVVMRERKQNKDGQLNLFSRDDYIYRSILTNDHQSSEKEVIEYYNQRGTSEQLFDIMNNDFGWNRLPCSDMNHNTVYLVITAIIKNLYNYLIENISKTFSDIPIGSRLKKFIFRFISVCAKWIKKGRQWHIKLYTDRPYDIITFK